MCESLNLVISVLIIHFFSIHYSLLLDKNENALLTSEGYHDTDDLIKLIESAVKEK